MVKKIKKNSPPPTKSPVNLVIDYGNTLTKAAIFINNQEIKLITTKDLTVSELESLNEKHKPHNAIVSSVVELPENIREYLKTHFTYIELSHTTPIPISNLYQSPQTLGHDRLAVAVAAFDMFPKQNSLVIDAGTCITFDFVDNLGNYYGGGIAPGINMRFKALHTFTERLPLVKKQKFEGIYGTTTQESILAGVLKGIVAEYDGIIHEFHEKYPGLKVMITGGDVNFFDKKLKSNIFAVPNMVLIGLNKILSFNANKQQEDN
jgi:type III pantothenate kinase